MMAARLGEVYETIRMRPQKKLRSRFVHWFGELAGFLHKLGNGLELDVNQDPDDYEPIGSAVSSAAPSGRSGWADEAGRPAAFAYQIFDDGEYSGLVVLVREDENCAVLVRLSSASHGR